MRKRTRSEQLTNAERAQRVARAYRAARAELSNVTNRGANRLIKLVKDFQKEVVGILATYAPDDPKSSYNTAVLSELVRSFDSAIDELRTKGLAEIEKTTNKSFALGVKVAADSVWFGSGTSIKPFVSPGLLLGLSRTPATAYSEMTARLARQIDKQIQLNAMGLQTHAQTVYKIATLIRNSREAEDGFRRRTSFESQAELIVRTETGRLFNSAHQAASEDALKLNPGMLKAWSANETARRGHKEAQEKYGEGGSIGPIPITMKFEVTDYSRTGETEYLTLTTGAGAQRVVRVAPYQRRGSIIIDFMMYPGDPEASAGNWANCRCIAYNVFPGMREATDEMSKEIGRGFR